MLLWWLADDPALSPKARSLIADEKNLIFVSAASMWEIVIKKSLDKLHTPDNLRDIIQKSYFKELSLTVPPGPWPRTIVGIF
jgi:PIN domain nuclease of toxin-antitoxin system